MATKRKVGGSRAKKAKPRARAAGSGKRAVTSKGPQAGRKSRAAGHPAKSAAPAGRPAKSAAPAGRPAKSAAPAGRPAKPAAKGGGTKARLTAAERRAMAAVVRPIGVLPPEAVARAVHKARLPARRAVAPVSRSPRPSVSEADDRQVTESDIQELEQRLLAERQRILKELGHLENTVLKVNQRDSAGDLSGYSFHMADVGTDAMEREKAFLFASHEGRRLLEIDEALRRVYRGEYGACEDCEQPIARARLQAMPHARLCLQCKEKRERQERAGRGAS